MKDFIWVIVAVVALCIVYLMFGKRGVSMYGGGASAPPPQYPQSAYQSAYQAPPQPQQQDPTSQQIAAAGSLISGIGSAVGNIASAFYDPSAGSGSDY